MGKAQREKGVRAERLFRDLCRAEGFANVERGCQLYQTGREVADVVGLPGIHIEVKNVQRLNVRAAMEQSTRDTLPGELPIVAHKMDRKPWLITMLAADWFKLYREYLPIDSRGACTQ